MECVANLLGSRPMPRTHLDTRRHTVAWTRAAQIFGLLGRDTRQLCDWCREGSCPGLLVSARLARSERASRFFAAGCLLGPWHSHWAPHHRHAARRDRSRATYCQSRDHTCHDTVTRVGCSGRNVCRLGRSCPRAHAVAGMQNGRASRPPLTASTHAGEPDFDPDE
jgi:hypothetical protein